MLKTKSILGLNSPFKYHYVYSVQFLIDFDMKIVLNGPVELKISILPTLTETVIFIASGEVIY